jgi:aldose 1-epimerase
MARIGLQAARWHAVIDAQLGGALLELSHGGEPVLRPATQNGLRRAGVRASACYPLVPFANRIGYGRLTVAGREYVLRANFPPEPHAVHGIGWQRPWTFIGQDRASAELLLRYGGDSPREWPFAFDARQRFELSPSGLKISISVVNRDRQIWPAGIGLHPYFPARSGQTLQFEADGAWQNGPDQLPLQRVAGLEWNFRKPRRVAGLDLDHDFHRWRGWVRIDGGSAGTVRIAASEVFQVLRVFTPAGRGFIAVEPVSHAADAVNRAAEDTAGYTLLAPGEALCGRVSIELEGCA